VDGRGYLAEKKSRSRRVEGEKGGRGLGLLGDLSGGKGLIRLASERNGGKGIKQGKREERGEKEETFIQQARLRKPTFFFARREGGSSVTRSREKDTDAASGLETEGEVETFARASAPWKKGRMENACDFQKKGEKKGEETSWRIRRWRGERVYPASFSNERKSRFVLSDEIKKKKRGEKRELTRKGLPGRRRNA